FDRDDPRRPAGMHVEHDGIGAPHFLTVSIHHLPVEQVVHQLHPPPPIISSGTTIIASTAPSTVMAASSVLPIGPLRCRLTSSSSFINTSIGKTTTGINTTVSETDTSVTDSG